MSLQSDDYMNVDGCNWCVVESFLGETQQIVGPFPSPCQAMSWKERREANLSVTGMVYTVSRILRPDFMPTRIHD